MDEFLPLVTTAMSNWSVQRT